MKFALGTKVRCKVTGYTGITINRTEHLNGCWRYGVQPSVDKDGKMMEAYSIDEASLELVEEKPVHEHKPVKTGGPMEKIKRF